jgi:phenylalanyl-tRNA synthetase beta chain
MRLPLSWLADHVEYGLAPEELAERLSAHGPGVEAIHRLGVPAGNGNLAAFRVGRVVECGPHPGADRLVLCRVDVGEGELRQIVCGAPNVAAGQTVAVALPGARLAGDRPPLAAATIRGVESRGMILAEDEVDLGPDHAGIMVLPEGLEPGMPLAEALPLSETVLELEVTPNRPDLLSVWGLAREVGAIVRGPLCPPVDDEPPADGPGRGEDLLSLAVEAPDLCPRYMARVLVDVRAGRSPLWLRARVEAAGMRAINTVVDVTNYVMLLTGQPLHAFDLDRLAGPAIVVRRARPGEPIVTLDGVRRELGPDVLAICDAERPVVIAGIFGAEAAEVGGGTGRVLLEAATFSGPAIMRAELGLGLRTESSARFEKGLPPELPPVAMRIACRMLVELAGARLVPGTLDACEPIPARPTVALRHARVRHLLGIDIPADEAVDTLRRLGFAVSEAEGALEADVPAERAGDVSREADLIEEVGRIHGYDAVPAELPRTPTAARRTPRQAMLLRLGRLAADLGLFETVSLRMGAEADLDRLRLPADDPRRRVVRLENPLSEDQAAMRTSLLPGLLRAVARNQAHQRPDGGLFEAGRVFLAAEDGRGDEREVMGAVLFGAPGGGHWRTPTKAVDVHAAVGLAEALARGVGALAAPRGPGREPYGHPARQATLAAGGLDVAWAGEVHPLVLRAFDVRAPVAAVEIDLDALAQALPAGPPQFADLPSAPASTRDLAVVVPEDVMAAGLVAAAHEAGGPLLRHVTVVDRYSGPQVPAGRVSLALRLLIGDPERTLTDAEIDGVVAAVAAALEERLGAERRT